MCENIKELDDKIECPICHKKFKSLPAHIFQIHNMTKEDFLKEYPNTPLYSDKTKVKLQDRYNNYSDEKKTRNG